MTNQAEIVMRVMRDKWSELGEKAGKTEGWMNLEETLDETLAGRSRQYINSPEELVRQNIEDWEETDHFTMLYGQPMMDDARDENEDDMEAALEDWQEYKEAFWEGYLNGRASIGRDIYEKARKLWNASQKKSAKYSAKPRAKRKSRPKSGSALGITRLSR